MAKQGEHDLLQDVVMVRVEERGPSASTRSTSRSTAVTHQEQLAVTAAVGGERDGGCRPGVANARRVGKNRGRP
jgi:hypothetical protein